MPRTKPGREKANSGVMLEVELLEVPFLARGHLRLPRRGEDVGVGKEEALCEFHRACKCLGQQQGVLMASYGVVQEVQVRMLCSAEAVLLARRYVRCSIARETLQAPHQAFVSTQPSHLSSSFSPAPTPALLVAVPPHQHCDNFHW